MASAGKKLSSKGRSASVRRARSRSKHFVICIRNEDYPASLELRKLYVVLADAFAAEHQMLRIIDESGEDYLYPASYFVRVELPQAVERTLRKIA
jgi:hypothetical protein